MRACQVKKANSGPSCLVGRMGNLFLTALGWLSLAAMSTLRRP